VDNKATALLADATLGSELFAMKKDIKPVKSDEKINKQF
jgi:hypothetical protein